MGKVEMQAEVTNSPNTSNSVMAVLLLLSTIFAAANTLLYKATLNAFSSPTTNYGFFAGQFSQLLYMVQAGAVSMFISFNDVSSLNELSTTPQSIYIYMGLLDAGSSTLAAISGGQCPGELQTILNQLIIPMTLIGASVLLGSTFKFFQIAGSSLITFGAIVASLSYFFSLPNDYADTDSQAASTASVVTYFASIAPAALSNIYKEGKMKERDMHEFHTSTIVSFWQLWFGFIFLPLLFIPALGGLKFSEVSSQLSDGFQCFLGSNPADPDSRNCESAFTMMMLYILVNFLYNVLLLAITKRGSAVLLVVSQALSLPVTNIAFSLRIFMGDDAEPLSILDLVGLLLVCIGFLTYSGFGFASNFMVASGAPGQMTYLHFEDVDQVIISTKIVEEPEQMNKFLVGSLLQKAVSKAERLRAHNTATAAASANRQGGCLVLKENCNGGDKDSVAFVASTTEQMQLLHSGNDDIAPIAGLHPGSDGPPRAANTIDDYCTSSNSYGAVDHNAADIADFEAGEHHRVQYDTRRPQQSNGVLTLTAAAAAPYHQRRARTPLELAFADATPLAASKKALSIAKEMVELLEEQVELLREKDLDSDDENVINTAGKARLSTPEILRQFTAMSPSISHVPRADTTAIAAGDSVVRSSSIELTGANGIDYS